MPNIPQGKAKAYMSWLIYKAIQDADNQYGLGISTQNFNMFKLLADVVSVKLGKEFVLIIKPQYKHEAEAILSKIPAF